MLTMNKTPVETRNRVFEYWLEGKSRVEIAKKLAISQGNVSSIINSWPSSLKPLRDLAKTLKKHKILPIEAKQGVEVLNQLKEVDVKPEQTTCFIQSAKKLAKQKNFQPKQLIKAATKIAELEAKSGKNYPQIIKHFKKLTLKNQDLKEENKKLTDTIKANKQKESQSLKGANTTIKRVNQQQKLIDNLQDFDLNFDDLGLIRDFLQNIKDSEDDPKRFLDLTRENGALAKQIRGKQTQLKKLKKDIKEDEKNLDQALENSESFRVQTSKQTKEILDTKNNAELSLQHEQNKIQQAQAQHQSLNVSIAQKMARNEKLSEETAQILGIKDYALENQQVITNLQIKKTKLQSKIINKQSQIKLAELVTGLLTNAQKADFTSVKYWINQIEKEEKTPNNIQK